MRFVRAGSVLLCAALVTSCSTLETAEENATRVQTERPGGLAFDQPLPELSNDLRLALVRPVSWDPTQVSMADQDAVIVSDLLFDGLTESTADGRLVPALATSWSATPDQYAWTFALDTTRTTAADVEASFLRLRADAPDSVAAATIETVVRIEVLDEATIRFVLSAPNAGFAWLVSGLAFSIVDDSGATTGRYEVREDSDEATVLRLIEDPASEDPAAQDPASQDPASDDPASDDLASQDPGIETESGVDAEVDDQLIIIDWLPDHESAMASANEGVVDGAVVPVAEAEMAAREVGASVSARSIVRFFGLNPQSEVFDDVAVRRAVLASVDSGALVAALEAPAVPASGLVAATVPGFTAGSCADWCGVDPKTAAAVVADAGPVSTLRVGYSSDHEHDLANALTAQLTEAGFDAAAVEYPAGGLPDALSTSAIDIFPFGWVAPAGSTDAVIPPLLGASSTNPIGLVSDDVDAVLATAALTVDDVARWELLESAHRLILEAGWFVPVSVAENRFVVSPAFTGVVVRADGSLEIRSLP